MLFIRRIDYGGQWVLFGLMIVSIPVLYFYGFLAGLFALGIWQLISAILNKNTFIHSVYRREIRIYWICCFIDLMFLVSAWFLSITVDAGDADWIYIVAIAGGFCIAVYYLLIYNNLIRSIALRNEVDGLTKSKH